MPDTYQIQVECSNCDHSGPIALSKGTPSSGEHECPNCGCKTATKAKRQSITLTLDPSRLPSTRRQVIPLTIEEPPRIMPTFNAPTRWADCDDDAVKRSLTGVNRFGWIQHDGYMSRTTNGVEVIVP